MRELQTRLHSVQPGGGQFSPGRVIPAGRANLSTGELSTSSSINDIPVAKVSLSLSHTHPHTQGLSWEDNAIILVVHFTVVCNMSMLCFNFCIILLLNLLSFSLYFYTCNTTYQTKQAHQKMQQNQKNKTWIQYWLYISILIVDGYSGHLTHCAWQLAVSAFMDDQTIITSVPGNRMILRSHEKSGWAKMTNNK